MTGMLAGKKVAIIASDGFEEVELTEPKAALEAAGATVHVVAEKPGTVRGYRHLEPGDQIAVDIALSPKLADRYDALFIPGGLYNPDALRTDRQVLDFVRHFFDSGKPVGAICHGPQVLISAGLTKGRTMTGWKAIQIDLTNAGAEVRDEAVVVDGGLVTSRQPGDLEEFCPKLVEVFAGKVAARAAG